jgi:hypothetical protein
MGSRRQSGSHSTPASTTSGEHRTPNRGRSARPSPVYSSGAPYGTFCHDEGVGSDSEPPTSATDSSEPEWAFSETGEIITTNASEPASEYSHPYPSAAVATYGGDEEGGTPVREPRHPRPPQGPATVSGQAP